MSYPSRDGQSLDAFRWLGMNRPELFTLVFVVGLANAMVPEVLKGIIDNGAVYAVLNTFQVSAIVWLAIFMAISYASAGERGVVTSRDRLVCIGLFVASLLPIGPGIWLCITALALYLIVSSVGDAMSHRAGWVMLAITVPMFWSKRVFNFLSEYFLAFDAELVSAITGTQRVSNLVPIPNGSGFLQIAAPCSSMANVSLAILCWILFTQSSGVRWQRRNVFWCAVACISVVAINVCRISLIGFFPDRYEVLHGPVGTTIASWLTIIAVLIVCYYGVGRGRFKLI
ncbi:hypothetical protein FVA81_01605 (plasmid) [Rhizobium sp. WL3]|uniref:hypothetical protein n=1 Tax=Rhizobium sp. WL3 TaxID=2603277 RepID=UPI0011C1F5C6|nr:hypothetical protein [Rhizobium sp. WL3]QEE43370.1 hypothetical protein FVA81_01605 [Rhizobium sp. WL3]